jgi:hypothetical protein
MLGLVVPAVSADEGDISILSEEVTSQFPDGISFDISLESSSPIDEVRVFYRSESTATTSYGYLEFEPGLTSKGHFFLDTSIGGERGSTAFVPPGAIFRYSYEVRDETGNILRTEEKEFVYIDPRFEWMTISEGPLTVYHYGPTQKRAETVLQSALDAVTNMSRVLGVDELEHINIVAYNNYRHMVTALPPRAQAVSEELVTQGQAFTNIRVLLVLAFDEDIKGITSHEVVHILVDDAAGRAYTLIPAWLNEGLAEFGNVAPNESYDNALLYGIYTRRLKPLGHLTTFSGDPDDVIIAYGHSRSVVSYLIDTYGEDKMARFIAALDQSLSVDSAMTSVYGFDQQGLDSEWRSRIGLRPFEDVEDIDGESSPTVTPSPTPAIESTPEAQPTHTLMPREDEGEPSTSPGCNRGSGSSASVPVDPFFLLLLAGPLGLFPLRRLRKPRI